MGEPFRWGILSTADITSAVIPAIRASRNGELVAIASRDAARASAWAAKHTIPTSFGSYDELLSCGAIDGVYNPLPNSLHAQWTIRALEAGLPVLCEKPFATSAAEARVVTAVARRTGLPVAEAFMYRYHPQIAKVLDLVARGVLGELRTIHAQFGFFLDDRDGIVASAALAGGALRDVGCYCVDLARLIAGGPPRRVFAVERRSAVDDTMVGLLEFPGGLLASFATSIETSEQHRVEIAGTEARLVLDQPWVPGAAAPGVRLCRWGQGDELIAVPAADTYRLEVEEFADVCAGRTTPRWPIDGTIATLEIIDALLTSAAQGQAVELRG